MTTPTTFPWLALHHRTSSSYDGRELQPYQGRPGAMDAFALPSIVNGVRTPRTLPICAPTTYKT